MKQCINYMFCWRENKKISDLTNDDRVTYFETEKNILNKRLFQRFLTSKEKQGQATKSSNFDGTQDSTFNLNDFDCDKNYCLNDFINFDGKNLDQYTFKLVDLDQNNGALEDENLRLNSNQQQVFIKIKKKNYNKNGQ